MKKSSIFEYNIYVVYCRPPDRIFSLQWGTDVNFPNEHKRHLEHLSFYRIVYQSLLAREVRIMGQSLTERGPTPCHGLVPLAYSKSIVI